MRSRTADSSGCCCLRSLGGAEMEHPDFLKVVRVFAEADASVAWCINQNNVFSTNAVRVPEETAREIWTVQRNVVTNGPPMSPVRGPTWLTVAIV